MDPIISSIVTPVVESLLVPVKKHLGYLISTTKYVENMNTKMVELVAIRSDIVRRKTRNEITSHQVPARVPGWLAEVGEIEEQVKSIDSTNVGSCFNLKVRHRLGRKACNIIVEINRLMGEKANIDWADIPIILAEVDPIMASTSTPLSDYYDFKSRESVYMEVLNALKPDNKHHMIALCGMGGVGKTKTAEKLKKVVSEEAIFDVAIEVAVGENKDVFHIQNAIAEQLSIELNERTKEARIIKLRKGFHAANSEPAKKKFLLILDDLWEKVDLKDIGLSPNPDQGIDFKVLVTSRDRDVCIQMGVELDSIFNLDVIKDLEAHYFFLHFAKISDDIDLREIGRDITIRCHGLPIAIKTIALTLKGQIKEVWEDTLSKLEHKNVREVVDEVFAISYKHLPDEETRLTLLLCGLFPEDFDTPKEELVRYAYGLKLFTDVNTIRETRSRLNTCTEKLIHANLLIRSHEVRYVKMHDLVRGFVLDVSSKSEHSTLVDHMSNRSAELRSESYKKISLTCKGMHSFPTSPKNPNLSLLKLMDGDESMRFSENFYQEMKNLKVIAYDRMKCPLNLRSLQCSSDLRTLCLHQCSLMSDCSSIGNLLNLEVLSFASSSIHKLPSTIVNLKKLKLLDLTGCWLLCIDDGILKSLVNLKELYMSGVRGKVSIKDDELVACVENLDALEIEFFDRNVWPQNMSFENLKRFRISLGCHLDKIHGLGTFSSENTLMLVTNECELLVAGLKKLFEKAQVLYLDVNDINEFEDGLGASLHNLRVLHIYNTNLRNLFTIGVANSLKKLEYLQIDQCHVLQSLVDTHEICEIEVPALKFLSLKDLPMLMSLCKGGNAIELPQLEEVALHNIPNFTSIYQLFLKKEVMSSKLKMLYIYNMEKLVEIWPTQLSNDDRVISQLKKINVQKCDSLVDLFPSNPMSLLHHLEELRVMHCNSLDVIFKIDLESCDGEIKEGNGSNLRYIQIWDCRELGEVWRVKGVNNDLPILCFQAVEHIDIEHCKSLKNVFTPTTSKFEMESLTRITLKGHVWEKENKSDNSHIDMTRSSLPSPSIPRPYEMVNSSQAKEHSRVGVAYSSFCRYLKAIHITECDALLNLIPFHAVGQMPKLEVLKISRCMSMREIFGIERVDEDVLGDITDIGKGNGDMGSAMTIIPRFTNRTSLTVPNNLKVLHIEECHSLKYIFTSSQLESLKKLQELNIKNCSAIQVIVKHEENGLIASKDVDICCLKSLTLVCLPNLKGFFLEENKFKWKSLNKFEIYGCPQMMIFTAGASEALNLEYIHTGVGKHSLECGLNFDWTNAPPENPPAKSIRWLWFTEDITEYLQYPWSFSNLIEVDLKCSYEMSWIKTFFPSSKLVEVQNLGEPGDIEAAVVADNDVIPISKQLMSMDPQTSSHTTSWKKKNHWWTATDLSNLTKLSLRRCSNLEYVFSYGVVATLVQLQDLHISYCRKLKVIVEQVKDSEIKTNKVVSFRCLKSLKLHGLDSLKGFCLESDLAFKWPALHTLEINRCPKMTVFTHGRSTAPKLEVIKTMNGLCEATQDFNSFIRTELQEHEKTWRSMIDRIEKDLKTKST